MKKIIDSDPAPFPQYNTEEYNSVIKLLDLLDKTYIKPDPKIIDKFPNTDGLISLVNLNQVPKGKCEIQIKTLPDSDVNKPKYQCTKQFLSYCESSLIPVILIAVNSANEIAYWLHISRRLLKELSTKLKGESITVELPVENEISRSNNNYIKEWNEILDVELRRVIDYEGLTERNKALEEMNQRLMSLSKPVHTIPSEDIVNFHVFLDTLNNSLDNNFSAIKQIFYKGYWKLGIAYQKPNDHYGLSFALYPVRYGQNDVLLREMPSIKVLYETDDTDFIAAEYHSKNPINISPVEFAYRFIKKDTLDVIKKKRIRVLDVQLAKEYITDTLDYHSSLSLAEIDLSELKQKLLKSQIRISTGKVDIPYLIRCIDFLLHSGETIIARIYPLRNSGNRTGWVYNNYSAIQASEKLNYIIQSLPRIFDDFINTLFPALQESIKFFNGFDLLMVNLSFPPDGINSSHSAFISMYYLNSEQKLKRNEIRMFLNEEDCPIKRIDKFRYFDEPLNIDGIQYLLTKTSGLDIHPIYEPYALSNYLYQMLESRFTEYFKTLTSY